MTPYDAAMAGVILAGMVWGAFRGITWQLASIASLILGYSVSHPLSGQLAPYFPGDAVVARSLAMITVYFATAAGVFFAAWLIRATLRRLKFEAFDRHLGMVLGGVEGAILGLVVTLFVVSLAPRTRDPIFNSPTGKVVGQLMSVIGPVLPAEARGVLAPFWSSPTTSADQVADTNSETPAQEVRKPSPGGGVDGKRDQDTTAASLKDLIEQGETRLGKAISDGTAAGIQRAIGGGTNDGTVKRR